MGASEEKTVDHQFVGLALLVGLPIFMILSLWLLRFLPVFVLGGIVGYFCLSAAHQLGGLWRQVRIGLLNFLFFSLFLAALVGLPFSAYRVNFHGALFAFDGFTDWVSWLLVSWNDWIPKWMEKAVAVKPVTEIEIVSYFWISAVAALFICALGMFRRLFTIRSPLKSALYLRVTSAPARLLNRILLLDFLLGPLSGDSFSESGSGFRVGVSPQGELFDLTERNLNYHVEIVAPTGSGKTNLLMNLISNRISQGHGVIFLDFKAEFETVTWIYEVSKAVGREKELRFLSLSDPKMSVPYNPFKYGDATDIHSALMNAMTWSEPFYRSVSSEVLLLIVHALVEHRQKTGELFHLGNIYSLLDDARLLGSFGGKLRTLNCPMAGKIGELSARLQKPKEKENLAGLLANLNQLLYSSAGNLLSKDVTAGSFDFRDSIPRGEIVIMLMNSLKLKESAGIVGKLILQDLMSYVGNYYGNVDSKGTKPISLIIDEFAGFATPQFIEFMDRARGAGIGIIFAHQSRADLRQVSPEFQERVEANSNTVLVSGVKNPDDAEFYASILGTRTGIKDTHQVQGNLVFGDIATGGKSRREVEEFILHPNRIKELRQGELLAICRTVDPRWSLVKVPKARSFEKGDGRVAEKYFERVRGEYLCESGSSYLNLDTHMKTPSATPGTSGSEWD